MRGMGMQQLSWGWPALAFGSACALGAASVIVLARPDSATLAGAAAAAGPSVHLAVLVAAVLTYLHWRLSHNPLSGWLTLVVVMLSTPHHAFIAEHIADPTDGESSWWPLVTRVLITACLLVLVLLAGRSEQLSAPSLPVDPMAAGLSIAICFSALGLALVRRAPDLELSSTFVRALNATLSCSSSRSPGSRSEEPRCRGGGGAGCCSASAW